MSAPLWLQAVVALPSVVVGAALGLTVGCLLMGDPLPPWHPHVLAVLALLGSQAVGIPALHLLDRACGRR